MGLAEHHDHYRPKHRSPVFETGNDLRRCNIAGDASYEQLPDRLAEDELDRNSGIRARQDGTNGSCFSSAMSRPSRSALGVWRGGI
jgi:hypothetical protein